MMLRTRNRIEAIAYGSILGGALGNVVDRVRFRAVTDFFDFYLGSAHWPAFNMADVFVVGGVWIGSLFAGHSTSKQKQAMSAPRS